MLILSEMHHHSIILPFFLSFLVCFLATSVSANVDGPKIAHDLQSILSPSSKIYLPNNETWASSITPRFNTWNSPIYVVAVKPFLVEDVQKVVCQLAIPSTGGL